jgi:hypothetical protein
MRRAIQTLERIKSMGELDAYTDAFVHARLTRSSEGVLEVILHTRGNSLVFNDYTYEEFVDLFHQINQDGKTA